MEKEINIAEILKDCPKGTKLYSTIYGEVELEYVSQFDVVVSLRTEEGLHCNYYFKFNGKYSTGGECVLFPSKDQRDWSKFKSSERYFIDTCGNVRIRMYAGSEKDIKRKEFGNDFTTREQAEYAAGKVKELLSMRKEASNE